MQRWAPIILLLLLAVAFLYRTIFGGMALLPAGYLAAMRPWGAVISDQNLPQWNPLLWDGIAQFYPWRVFYSESLSSGFVPLWNPHQFCGTPFAANAQTAVFYPLNLLFVIFQPVRAFGVSAMLHLFLAGSFTFLLVRALGIGRFGATVAAVTFAFGGFMVVWLELPTFISVATWLPLALYLILKSSDWTDFVYAVLAGLALGISILGGHFQIASYVLVAALMWWIWLAAAHVKIDGASGLWRRALLAVATFAVAFLVAAPQILPTVELAGLSHRVREVTSEGFTHYLASGIPARNLITLFVPNFYGNPSTNSYWAGSAANFMEQALYIGLLPLALAIIGSVFAIRWRGAGFFLSLAIVSLMVSFGTMINAIPYYLVPGTSALGGPNRAIVLFCFSTAILAGYGAHWFAQLAQEEYKATNRKLGWRALAIGAAIFVVLFIISQFIASAGVSELGVDPGKVVSAETGQYMSFIVLLLAGLGVLALYTAQQIPKPVFVGLALAVIIGDLFSFGMGFNPVSPPEKVYPKTPLTNWLQRNAGESRVMPINNEWSLYRHPNAILPPNAATVYGFFDMQGYDSLFPKAYKEFVDGHLGMDSSPQENGNIVFIKTYVPDWPKGTASYVLSKKPLSERGLVPVVELDGVRVLKRTAYGRDQQVYLLPLDGNRPTSRAWVTGRTPNQVQVYAETDQAARLVLAESYYPGWTATVDGQPQPVGMAQGIFRSVTVEPGESSVTFSFEPGSFIVGSFLGLLGATIVGVGVGMAVVRRRTE